MKFDTNRAVQSEFLTLHKRECSDSKCGECGVDKRLDMKGTCVIDNDSTKYVSYRKYINVDTITKDGTLKQSTQKVLHSVTATQKTFFDEFHKVLKEKYLPHRWVSIWDSFHRQLLFDSIDWDTLLYHTDFSATYTCMGQDGATCVHDKTAIQAVFVVAYTILIDGVKIKMNDSWHFWGVVNAFSYPSNYVFHNTC